MTEALYREFLLTGPEPAREMMALLRAQSGPSATAGRPLRVIVTEEEADRVDEQIRYYFGVVIRAIAEQAWVDARNDALEKAAAAASDAATAHAAGQRLRARVDSLVADAARRHPDIAAGGPATGAPIDMLAHVLGRALNAAGQLAAYADRARIAGLTCERAYESLEKVRVNFLP